MNTAQIAHALEADPITKKTFCGVFPCDKLPQTIDKYPCGFVANTDPSSKPGTHWISIWIGPSDARGDHNKILGNILTATGLMYHWCLETIWKNTLINGNITNVNCKVFGPTYAGITVYST